MESVMQLCLCCGHDKAIDRPCGHCGFVGVHRHGYAVFVHDWSAKMREDRLFETFAQEADAVARAVVEQIVGANERADHSGETMH